MRFNKHSNLEGLHAPFGASKPHWLNYSDEKIELTLRNQGAAARGTRIHNVAKEMIELGFRQPETPSTFNQYVNDAIGYRMSAEVVLFYSFNIFGTADAISLRDGVLRIHDLKTGIGPVKMTQLMVYAAIFCLEYNVEPNTINVELRIYQNDHVETYCPESDEIRAVMNRIVYTDKYIEDLKEGGTFL